MPIDVLKIAQVLKPTIQQLLEGIHRNAAVLVELLRRAFEPVVCALHIVDLIIQRFHIKLVQLVKLLVHALIGFPVRALHFLKLFIRIRGALGFHRIHSRLRILHDFAVQPRLFGQRVGHAVIVKPTLRLVIQELLMLDKMLRLFVQFLVFLEQIFVFALRTGAAAGTAATTRRTFARRGGAFIATGGASAGTTHVPVLLIPENRVYCIFYCVCRRVHCVFGCTCYIRKN